MTKINYDATPGTTTLVDTDHSIAAIHSKKDADIVLVPTPSDDPDDPLNWSPRRKALSLFCMVVYTFGVGIPSAAIYSIIPHVAVETGIDVGQLNTGTGYMFLFFGLGCCLFQPLALQYGKRNVYLFSMLATTLLSIWPPHCKTYGEWIGQKILQGAVGSPIESLCEISVSDVSFQHQLSRNMSIYATALLTSNFLAPMVAGFISDGMSWEWVMYFCAIFGAVCFVFLFIFMEETNYERKLKPSKLVEEVEGFAVSNPLSDVKSDEEKKLGAVLSRQTIEERLQNVNEVYESSNESESDSPPKRMKTFREKMSLTSGVQSKFLLPYYLLGPFKMMQFPPVLWGGFLYGSSLVWFNLLNATEATVLGGAPYNWSSSMCGLAYISPTIFSCIFQFTSGYLADMIKIRAAKGRGGTSYSEDRLWVLVIYMVFGLLGSIGWGAGAYYGKHWFLLVFCMGMLGGLGVFGCVAGCSYACEVYHEMDTEAMVVVILIRNLMSFACSYGLTDWVNNMGYRNAFISSGCILFFCNGTFLIMKYTGLYWRESTKVRYWKLVEHKRQLLSGSA